MYVNSHLLDMGAECGSQKMECYIWDSSFGKVLGLVLDKQGNKDYHCDAVGKTAD